MRFKLALITMALAGILVGIGISPSASAIPFSDFVDFAPDNNFQTVTDTVSGAPLRSWTHNILDDLSGNSMAEVSITDARLVFRYSKTEGNEQWFLNQDLGTLPVIGENELGVDFPLGAAALADLQEDGIITFVVSENTVGSDTFRRYDATLRGEYAYVGTPEPPSSLLIWMGVVVWLIFSTWQRVNEAT